MKEHIISPSEADLLLHRYVTERVPVVVWFVSADESVKVKVTGFITSSTAAKGIHVAPEWPEGEGGKPASTFMILTDTAGCECWYSDETSVPEDFKFGSGLCLTMPNGNTLTILEQRNITK